MSRVALLVAIACLFPAAASAQWRGYDPDSAEYRLVMRAGSPGGATGQMTVTHGAVLHARARGNDSLTVSVRVRPSDFGFGDERPDRDSSLASAVEIPISRRGSAADVAQPLPGGAIDPHVFAHVFVSLAYPRRDAGGRFMAPESDPDSMARLGMRATSRRFTLPDTVVNGVTVSREVGEMSMTTDSSITPRAGMPSVPPMEAHVRTEQWFDPAFRVLRSTMRNRVRPRAGAGSAAGAGAGSVLANGMDMFMEFERLPLRPR